MGSRTSPFKSGRMISDWKVTAKVAVGRLAVRLFPKRVRRLEENLNRYRATTFEKILKAGLFGDAYLRRDDARLMSYHRRHWLSPNVRSYYRQSEERFRRLFLSHQSVLIDVLERYLRDASSPFARFVEIGCGAGLTTFYMAERFPDWEECVGLDLSAVWAEGDSRRRRDPRIRFVTADALQWIPREGRPYTVFLTNGGVLEYFSKEKLVELLDLIGVHLSPSLFLAIEPLAADHDLENDPRSRPHGPEMTFSHNYPQIFSQAGFQIEYREEQVLDGVRWLLLFAGPRP